MGKIYYLDSSDGEKLIGEITKGNFKEAELYQQAGFSHIPEKPSTGIMIEISQSGSHNIVICTKYRDLATIKEEGETFIYSVKDGVLKGSIYLDKDGNIIMNNGNKGVARDGDEVTINIAAGAIICGGYPCVATTIKGSITSSSSTIKVD